METRRLTPEQLQKLRDYAARNGRNWKQAMGADWYACRGDCIDIRNQFGPSWLVNFRFSQYEQPAEE